MKAASKLLSILPVLSFTVGLFILSPALGLAFSQQVNAQTGTIESSTLKFKVRPLYNGYYKNGDWLPVEIKLENYGEPTEITIEAAVTTVYGKTSQKMTYRQQISLARQANKTIIFYIKANIKLELLNSISYHQPIIFKKGPDIIDEKTIEIIPFKPSQPVRVLHLEPGSGQAWNSYV